MIAVASALCRRGGLLSGLGFRLRRENVHCTFKRFAGFVGLKFLCSLQKASRLRRVCRPGAFSLPLL
jgi:hypothetical protein